MQKGAKGPRLRSTGRLAGEHENVRKTAMMVMMILRSITIATALRLHKSRRHTGNCVGSLADEMRPVVRRGAGEMETESRLLIFDI